MSDGQEVPESNGDWSSNRLLNNKEGDDKSVDEIGHVSVEKQNRLLSERFGDEKMNSIAYHEVPLMPDSIPLSSQIQLYNQN